jgi:hypothetical protein
MRLNDQNILIDPMFAADVALIAPFKVAFSPNTLHIEVFQISIYFDFARSLRPSDYDSILKLKK